jgi:HEAT repeat protein
MSHVRLPGLLVGMLVVLSSDTAQGFPWPPLSARQWADVLTDSRDARSRARAAEALGKLGPRAKDAVPALVAALDDDAPLVQLMAADALGRVGPDARAAVPRLVAGLKPDRQAEPVPRILMTRGAKEALVGIGEPAVGAVTELLAGDSAGEQAAGAEILARIGPAAKAARPTLEGLFKDSKGPLVRIWAAAASVRVGADPKAPLDFLKRTLSERGEIGMEAGAALGTVGPSALPILMDALTGKDANAVGAADTGLRRLGPAAVEPLTKLLQSKDRRLRRVAASVLGDLEPADLAKAVPALVAELRRGDEETWEEVGKALAHAGSAAVPPLLEVLRTERGRGRLAAVYTLNRIAGRDSDPEMVATIARTMVPGLVEELGGKDAEAREHAVHFLGRMGPHAAPAVPALLRVAAGDPSPGVRGEALEAVGATGVASDEVLKTVLAGLADKNGRVRSGAIHACASLGPPAKDAVPLLVGLVGTDTSSTPEPPVYALGRIGPAARAAAPKLLEVLKDEDAERAGHAAIALLRIGAEEKAAVAALTRALRHEELHIKSRTMGALHGLGPAGRPLVPLLKTVAADPASDEALRNEAARLLSEIDPEASRGGKKD